MNANDILKRCLAGDDGARDAFVEQYAGVVWAAVQHVVAPNGPADAAVDAADITQDVFLRLFRDDSRVLRSFDPDRASLITWLTVVARNAALDAVRRRVLTTVPFSPAAHSPADESPDSAQDDVSIPLHLLSPRQRLVLHILFDREMSVSEAAAALGVEEQTVRSTKHKALTKLRDFFGRQENESNGK